MDDANLDAVSENNDNDSQDYDSDDHEYSLEDHERGVWENDSDLDGEGEEPEDRFWGIWRS
jgi:hypothetical protein